MLTATEVTTLDWFVSMLGRLHLNGMRTTPVTALDKKGRRNQAPKGISVLYGLSSLLNHRCVPNIAPAFDGATVEWIATRDIEPEEELFISYTDGNELRGEEVKRVEADGSGKSSSPLSDDDWLHWHYGFRCSDSCRICGT